MATLQDLIKLQLARDAQKYAGGFKPDSAGVIQNGKVTRVPVPHSFQSAPAPAATPAPSAPAPSEPEPQWLLEAFQRIDELSARCDALLERNKRWTKYITG